jgi:hypothetical protein
VSGQLHALAALPLGKEPPVSIGQENGWAPELVWMMWRQFLTLQGLELQTFSHPACNPSLYWLHYTGLPPLPLYLYILYIYIYIYAEVIPLLNYVIKPMKAYGGVEVWLHHYWPQNQMEMGGEFHIPAALTPEIQPPLPHHRTGGWVIHMRAHTEVLLSVKFIIVISQYKYTSAPLSSINMMHQC